MARLYSNENFPLQCVTALRSLGHDVLTTAEDGRANLRIPDPDVLARAFEQHRLVLTLNRWDFIRLHDQQAAHCGIVVCRDYGDRADLAQRIHACIADHVPGERALYRIVRPN